MTTKPINATRPVHGQCGLVNTPLAFKMDIPRASFDPLLTYIWFPHSNLYNYIIGYIIRKRKSGSGEKKVTDEALGLYLVGIKVCKTLL
jgi:hypothetical protein